MSSVDNIPEKALPLLQATIVFLVFSTLAVGVRFWSRAVEHQRQFGWDDWTCLIAWVFNVGLCVVGFLMALNGLGRHVDDLSDEEIETLLEVLFAAYYLFDIGIGIVKYSALFFYARVFQSLNRWMNFGIYFGFFLVTAWELYMIFMDSFFCMPISKYWLPDEAGYCLKKYPTFISTGVFDVAVDVYLLLLPLPMLWSLHMKTSRKILISLAFIFAYCALAASIGRFASIMILGPAIDQDFSYNMTTVLIWSILEPSVAIISICLPSWFYFIRRWKNKGVASLFSSQEHPQVNIGNVLRGGPRSFRERITNFLSISSGSARKPSDDASLSLSDDSRPGVHAGENTAAHMA